MGKKNLTESLFSFNMDVEYKGKLARVANTAFQINRNPRCLLREDCPEHKKKALNLTGDLSNPLFPKFELLIPGKSGFPI